MELVADVSNLDVIYRHVDPRTIAHHITVGKDAKNRDVIKLRKGDFTFALHMAVEKNAQNLNVQTGRAQRANVASTEDERFVVSQNASWFPESMVDVWHTLDRPDVLYDLPGHAVIIECDENQHEHYDKNCEETRMHNIVFTLGKPTIFIRYNPDSYNINGVKQRTPRKERLKTLVERVKFYLDEANRPNQPLTVEYMYYDKVI